MSTINAGTEPNYVVTAMYDVTATDGDYYSFISDAAFFEVTPDKPNYIPYADLTNDIVIGWIQGQLGADGVASYESTLQDQINAQINPVPTPEPTPLPPNFYN